jgi:hypothetical protein
MERQRHAISRHTHRLFLFFLDFQDETQFGSDKIRSIKYMKHSEARVLIFLVILGTEASDRKIN